jgi:GNAT superfamily N-acetyltransferase
VRLLVAQVQEEFVSRYGNPDRTHLDEAMFEGVSGAFFVGFASSRPVAMGGWRFRPDVSALGGIRAAEIKRMYVVPEARRLGYARAVLAGLEESAATSGADVMILESGVKQPEALGLYAAAGYVRIPGYGIYRESPHNRCLAKTLVREGG